MRKLLLACSFIALSSSCATIGNYKARVRSWEGKDVSALTQSWGQPEVTEKLATGNQVLLYVRLKGTPWAAGESASGERNQYLRCSTYFYVDAKNNKIYDTDFRGDDCAWRS